MPCMLRYIRTSYIRQNEKIHGSNVYMGKKPMKYGKPEEEPLEYVEREEDNNLDREIEILRKN